MNILANAVDVLEESIDKNILAEAPQITIRTQRCDREGIKIAIADNGCGIPETIQQRLFDPFFTTKPVGKGTGMGLSISYQIITEKHRGKLFFCSTPGRGTEFAIVLPLSTAQIN